jgi:hypothetical protein
MFAKFTEHFEICTLLGYNTVSSGNPLPMFRDNVSVPSSRVKGSKNSTLLNTCLFQTCFGIF